MPDTKRGRERQGRKKLEQLEQHLTEREIETLDDDDALPDYPPEDTGSDLLSAPPQEAE
ncbi:hypothetical protein [Halobaculum roseum]|uniref:Uncharacterized protein n=1 Tax=Halobaculum roseum TaxID=2175149 RepID=A0ABD5MPD2_9EURY|nr:hypothetical protein [Halobaculum roseum]QZY02066.1 hypothetical protein K6T36_12215 [Halobaculum roseum]